MRGERAFRRLAKGRSGSSKYLSVRWRETRTGEVRVGIVVSRKVGNAVVRNRVRRRLREGLLALVRERLAAGADGTTSESSSPASSGKSSSRALSSSGASSLDLMIIARPSAAAASYAELKRDLALALQRGRVAWLA